MTFPVIESAANDTGNTTNWGAMNMPSGIVAGDLLIAFTVSDGIDVNMNFDGGWTKFITVLSDQPVGTHTLNAAWKLAVGGDTLTCRPFIYEAGACRVWRISGAADPTVQPPEPGILNWSTNSNDSTTAILDACTPTGGAKDYLWLALCGMDGDTAMLTGPTNYSNAGENSFVAVAGASQAWAERFLNAASEDPDNFEWDIADAWTTALVAIHPAAGGGGPTNKPEAMLLGI